MKLFGLHLSFRDWLVLAAWIVLSLGLAFETDVAVAKGAIRYAGYWELLALSLAAACFGGLDLCREYRLWSRWWQRGHWSRMLGLALLCSGAGVFTHLFFTHGFKVLNDEAVLMNTSQALQDHRQVYTPTEIGYRGGGFQAGYGYVDKRPWFHPFVVSLLNDLSGYRCDNGIWLNALLTLPLFAVFFFLGRRMDRRLGGAVSVGLAAGIPIFGQTLAGGGFEPLNLLLLLGTMLASVRYAERPTACRSGILVCSGLLLAYTRYESALYLVAVGGAIWWTMRRNGSLRLNWVHYVAPVLCAPLVWLQLIAFSEEYHSFQLAVNHDASAFGTAYLPRNLLSACHYFLVPSVRSLGSPFVVLLGSIGGFVFVVRFLRFRRRLRECDAVIAFFGGATLVNVAIFLLFNNGQYSAYITQRISLPVWGLLVLLAVPLIRIVPRRLALWLAIGVVVVNLAGFHLPVAIGFRGARMYYPARDFEFAQRTLAAEPEHDGVFVLSHMPPYWQCLRRPCRSVGWYVSHRDVLSAVLREVHCSKVWVHVIEPVQKERLAGDAVHSGESSDSNVRMVAECRLTDGLISRIYEMGTDDQVRP